MNKFMNLIGIKARKASEIKINTKIKNKVLNNYALLIYKEKRSILRENKKDIKFAENKGLKENLINRLIMNEVKLKGIVSSIKKISKLKDPVNITLEKWSRPNAVSYTHLTLPTNVAV